MDADAQKRLRWVELFLKLKNCGVVCLLCGISRPTLREWIERFEERGIDGLRTAEQETKRGTARGSVSLPHTRARNPH